jgi:hypothetical protein
LTPLFKKNEQVISNKEKGLSNPEGIRRRLTLPSGTISFSFSEPEQKVGLKKKPAQGWLRNTGSNVSNVVLSGLHPERVPPERMTIIIIIIRMCPAFFRKKCD